MPDEELLATRPAGDLQKPDVLLAQTRRMLKDAACADWPPNLPATGSISAILNRTTAVDRQRFPSFNNDLREAMFQEPIRFIEDVIRNDRSVLDLLYGNYTFVNPRAGQTLRHARSEGRRGPLGARGQCRADTAAAACCPWRYS